MPVWNGQKTIAGAINSILGQTYDNWELIIVNDGSTDNTHEEVHKFTDPRIQYFIQEHAGLVFARNKGNQESRGKYCIVQDADDYSLPDRLEKVVNVFQQTDADIVIHDGYINAWDEEYSCPKRVYLHGRGDVLKNEVPGWPAYKRECWIKKPFRYETQYGYDWMMHLDWFLSGFKYEFLEEGLYEYIRYIGSASDRFERSGLRAKAFEEIKRIVKEEYGKTIL